jgi:hypothetical protein
MMAAAGKRLLETLAICKNRLKEIPDADDRKIIEELTPTKLLQVTYTGKELATLLRVFRDLGNASKK